MMFNRPMDYREDQTEADIQLDQLFRAYRVAAPDPEAGANYMPALWARIEMKREERERSLNWFGHWAKGLVTAALATYLLVNMVSSPSPKAKANAYYNGVYSNGTFVDALVADHMGTLEPFHLDRVSHLEMGR
jgi:hypothetical protein